MITVKLSQWSKHFPDGVSLAAYQLIGKLIRQHGYNVTITITPGCHDSLDAALRSIRGCRV